MTRLLLVLVLLPAVGNAQPLTLPLLDISKVTVDPSITFDWIDGAGGDISFGSGALGVSEDGKYLYIGCNLNSQRAGIAKLAIPQGGGRATVVAPCSGPDQAEIKKIVPGWGAGAPTIGGVLEQGGKVCVTAFGSYDANGRAQASHWCGPSLTQLSGPFRGTVTPGFVHSQMGVVPPEWRALLGGPAFSTAGYTSITSRSSQGAALTVFDPKDVTADGFPMANLLGCPYSVPKCASRWTSFGPSTDHFDGSELAGGSFIVPGTRTLVVIEREGVGGECYGYATTDQTLHGTPYPSPEGVRYCYAPYDPQGVKGNKAQSYRLVAKLYDLADIAAVKAGTKKPEDIDQYATVTLPGSKPNEFVSGGAFNPVTGEFYLLRGIGGGVNTIHVLAGWAPGTAPPPPPPPPPPPADVICTVTGQGSRYSNGDRKPTVRCASPDPLKVGQTFTLKRQ